MTNFLFKLVNIRFADETLKLFIQTWEHAKPRLVHLSGTVVAIKTDGSVTLVHTVRIDKQDLEANLVARPET